MENKMKIEDINIGDLYYWDNMTYGKILVECYNKDQTKAYFTLLKQLTYTIKLYNIGEWSLNNDTINRIGIFRKINNLKIYKILYGSKNE
jgi:hypothetical protein